MSKLRKYIFLFSSVLFVVTVSIAVYLVVKVETISNQMLAEYHQFVKDNSNVIGNEAHLSVEDSKRAVQLHREACDREEWGLIKRFDHWSQVSLKISIISFFVALLTIIYGLSGLVKLPAKARVGGSSSVL